MLTLRRSQTSCRRPLGASSVARFLRFGPALALALLLGSFVTACTAPGDVDNADSNVIFNIEAIRQQSEPFGDVQTTTGVILDDVVEIDLSASLKAPISTNPTAPPPDLQNIVLDRYEVTFTRTDGGTATPPGFTRGASGLVRLSELGGDDVELFTITGLVILPSTIKAQPPISFLISPGSEPSTNFTNIQLDARIQFFGHTISGHQVTVVGNVGLNLANYGDDNS